MEFLAGVFVGFVATWPGLIVLAVLATLLVTFENYFLATLSAIVGAVAAYMFFGVTLESLAVYTAVYFVAGFVWSAWRYRRWVRKQLAEYASRNYSDSYLRKYREGEIENLAPKNQLGRLTAWVILWPFSVLENFTGDVIHLVETAISQFFKGVYNRIFESALQDLAPAIPNPPEPTSGDDPGPR